MNLIRYVVVGMCCFSLFAGLTTPADAQPKKATQAQQEEDVDDLDVSFMDSSDAVWFRRSVNDSIYNGYTVNGVFHERGRARLRNDFYRYSPGQVTFGKVQQTKVDPKPNYQLRVNGKVVEVKD